MWSDFVAILAALGTQDSFEIRNALRSNAAWLLGVIVAVVGGIGVALIYRTLPVVERYFERTVMVTAYLTIAAIIFWGVIDRFVFSNQQPWSTTIPPFLFMIMAWFGATYSVRVRTHLSFSEFRARMPRSGQFACLILDAALWFIFAVIVMVTATRATALSASNFQIVLGTDNTLQWWFLITVPLAFLLMCGRVFQNLFEDIGNWRSGRPMIKQAVIGGDT